MKWISHIVIGGSLAIAFNPVMLPVAVAGSTAPDWLESLSKLLGKPLKHRTTTHYLVAWAAACAFALLVWDYHGILFWFALGGLSHIFADSFTVMGVPVGWWSDRRFHLFGGRLKTGQSGEYFVAFGVLALAVVIGWNSGTYEKGFFPFFYHWQNLYETGVIDAYEWKQNRFKFI